MKAVSQNKLRWSAESPSRPGWYMFRQGKGAAAIPAKVFSQDGELHIQPWADIGWFRVSRLNGEFAFITK